MDRRLELHDILLGICPNVYFNPPETLKMKYPCIRYTRANANTSFADNNPYRIRFRYQITLIDKDPDSDLVKEIAELPTCVYDRHYTSNNLNHDVFNLYY